MKEPKVQVGILFEPQIEFVLLNPYRMDGTEVSGKQVVTYDEGKILWNGRRYDELLFEPQHEQTDAFELLDVTIGINFHWERKEDQCFLGALKIIVENGKLTGINVIHVEDYLTSVISSEMSATASLELLKAHTFRCMRRRPLSTLPGHYTCLYRYCETSHLRYPRPGTDI